MLFVHKRHLSRAWCKRHMSRAKCVMYLGIWAVRSMGTKTSLSLHNHLKNFLLICVNSRKDKKTAINCMKIEGANMNYMYVFFKDYLKKKKKSAFCQHCTVFTLKLFRHMCFQRRCNFLSDFLQILSSSCRGKSSHSTMNDLQCLDPRK